MKTLIEKLKNDDFPFFASKSQNSKKWPSAILLGVVLSALITFLITWLYLSSPTNPPATSETVIQSVQNPAQEIDKMAEQSNKTDGIADKIVDVVENRTNRKYVSKIQPEANDDAPGKEWSADTFLDVIKAPDMNSETATKIVIATQAPTESGQDPYVSSLLDEAVSLAVLPEESQNQGNERGEIASFQTATEVDQSDIGTTLLYSDGVFIVQQGDSLSKIALKLYGDGSKYKRIFEENRDILDDPHQIATGTRLRIPDY